MTSKKVLVVFGSKSDENVFMPIVDSLKQKKIKFDMHICSAHRTPEKLSHILIQKQYDLIIAGAGLAAHLPGVVASKTPAPVVGVPVDGAFQGLDAFLAIVQMPPGIPVLSCGINKNPLESDFLLKEYDSVKISGDFSNKRVKKCVETLEKFEVGLDGDKPLTINFFDLKTEKPLPDAINVPLMETGVADDALTFLDKSKTGFFVGTNRGDNAAVFAVSMIDYIRLIEYREEMAVQVNDADLDLQKKLIS